MLDTTTFEFGLISVEEVTRALKRLKNGNTAAEGGLVAEMLKAAHEGLVQAIANFFNELLGGQQQPPDAWRRTMLKSS